MYIETWMATTLEERQRYAAEEAIARDIKHALDKLATTHGADRLREPLFHTVSAFVGERVAPVDRYCTAFRQWRDALIADRGWKDPVVGAWESVFSALSKSSMLDRLIYGGEQLRTEKCPDPEHAGHWRGLDDTRHICLHGCGNTGWLPQPTDPVHASSRWFLKRFKGLPVWTKEEAEAVIKGAFEHGNPGVEGVPALEALGIYVSPSANGFHDFSGVRLQVRSLFYRDSERSLQMYNGDYFIPTAILPRPKPVSPER